MASMNFYPPSWSVPTWPMPPDGSDKPKPLAAPPRPPFDIVFLDPPFGLGLIAQSIELLDKQLWLAPYAKIYVETENTLKIDAHIPTNWHSLKHKVAGEVTYRLFENRSN